MRKEDYYAKMYARPGEAEERTPRLGRAIELLCSRRLRRVLDIGCGDGRFSLLIKRACNLKEIWGVDISPEAVRLAEEHGVKALRADVDNDNLPFPDESFDGVFCGELIEHTFDPDHMLTEIKRVLQPEGILVITSPNLASWFNRFVLLLGYQPYYTDVSIKHYVGKFKAFAQGGGGHIRVFTFRAMKEILSIHGFEVLETAGTYNYDPRTDPRIGNPWISFFWDFVERIMSVRPSLSSHFVFVVGKRRDGVA
jgi:SAM-dependent methyltransferase